MTQPAVSKVNLESLIEEEELEELNDIRVEQLPEQIEKIGEGRSGEVYRFKFQDNIRSGKKPKINLYSKSSQEKENMKKHLSSALREIKILNQLSHERIMKFFGFYLDQDQIIIFMECMAGSVKDKVDEKCLSEMEVMHYFTQAAEGLVYLHNRKPTAIIHRDIKCENLLLTAENNVKLADFGLAIDLAISSGSVSILPNVPTSLAETHYFIAPEVLGEIEKPEAYGRKSDVWSLACTLVQMNSGNPPFSNLSLHEFLQRSSTFSPNPLIYSGDLLPTASDAIKRLLNSLFIADSKLRPSADDVLALAYDTTRKAAAEDYNVAEKYYHGRDVPRSFEEACKWYAKAAEQGHPEAQIHLGWMYENGRGVPQSDEEAVKWYRKAAEQGHANGQCNLGLMYKSGRGVPNASFEECDEETLKWFGKAAEQGSARGQYMLGTFYLCGRGVPKSREEAVKWFRKAAEQGHTRAQAYLK